MERMERITPETYEKMNEEFEEKGLAFESLSLPKNKLKTGKMIDDNFRKIAVENHLEGVTKLVEGADWETPTNRVIADNLLDKVSSLLNAKIIRINGSKS